MSLYEDDLFRIEPCLEVPVAGYLILFLKGGRTSLADLDADAASRLGPALARAARAIETAVAPERVYCLLFAELTRDVHFHLFPRTREVLEAYWADTGTRGQPVDGPSLFRWARLRLGKDVPAPAADLEAACGRIGTLLRA